MFLFKPALDEFRISECIFHLLIQQLLLKVCGPMSRAGVAVLCHSNSPEENSWLAIKMSALCSSMQYKGLLSWTFKIFHMSGSSRRSHWVYNDWSPLPTWWVPVGDNQPGRAVLLTCHEVLGTSLSPSEFRSLRWLDSICPISWFMNWLHQNCLGSFRAPPQTVW